RRRHPGGDAPDQRVVDRPRPARHGADQAQRIGAGGDGKPRLRLRLDAADLDPDAAHGRSAAPGAATMGAGRITGALTHLLTFLSLPALAEQSTPRWHWGSGSPDQVHGCPINL